MVTAVALTILGICGSVLIGFFVGLASSEYYTKQTKRAKKKAAEADVWFERIHKKCIQSRDAEPFAAWMADEITNHLTKD